jgi:hypothetical protein
MAYNKEELEKQALEAIKEHGLVFIEEIVSFLPCSKPTFYEHGLNELDSIKEAITYNKVSKKAKLRKNWEYSENATLNISLYKLLANEEELQRLSVQKLEHSGKDGEKLNINIQVYGEDEPITEEPDE